MNKSRRFKLLTLLPALLLLPALVLGCLPRSAPEYGGPVFLYVPLDDRPVNRLQAAEMARLAGIRLVAPPRELLSGEGRRAPVEKLWPWVEKNSDGVDGAILSLDMLVYGGLAASRTHSLAPDVLARRVGMAQDLAESIDGPVYAFATVLRSAASSRAAEEADYYRLYGEKIFKLGVLEHRADLGLASEEELRDLARLQGEIPGEYLADYLTRRENNEIVRHEFTQLAGAKVLDYLVIGRDDCYPYGYSSREAREVERLIAEQGLEEAAATYPGADELGFMLLARAFNDLHNLTPRVYTGYGFPGAEEVTPRYEDVPLGENIEAHINSLGGRVAAAPEEADLALAVNAPRDEAVEKAWQEEFPGKTVPAATAGLAAELLARGLPVAVADVARANGAEPALMEALAANGLLADLAGYAGWNTAGNSIGAALALGSIYAGLLELGQLDEARQQLHQRCLLTRYIDDWGYQAVVRPVLMEKHDLTTTSLLDPALERQLAREAELLLQEFAAQNLEPSFGSKVPVDGVAFPWLRLFEIEFE
ncbi:MAG: DUF4127 family protein [Bacillota bacterium]